MMTVNLAWNIWNFRRPLVDRLLAAGHRITVVAGPDEAIPDLQGLGCRFVPLKMSAKGLNPIEELSLYRQLRAQIRADRPDIILGYTIKNNIFGALAARHAGVPFIPNVTGLGTAFLSGNVLQHVAETLYRWAFARLPVVFFQNEDDRDHFVQRRIIRPEHAELLPGSGIDLERFAPQPYPETDSAPVFLMIARLLRDKGVLEFVDAARRVRAVHPKARFQLLGAVGWENRTAITQDTVAEWEAEGAVEYLGTAPDVRPIIAKAHCVVLPSYREGAPRTLIEAAALGRPLIATDVPGCRAVVDHGQTGLLCQVRSGESLAEACLKFQAMPLADKRAMGEAARARMATHYDQKIVVAAYLQAMERLTGAVLR